MCWRCVVEEGGDKVILDKDMKRVCNLIWDWYHAPDRQINEYYPDDGPIQINGCGGALHVQLDDHNLDDDILTDNWYLGSAKKYQNGEWVECERTPMYDYSSETFALGQKIIEALRAWPQNVRQAVVHWADPYSSRKPFSGEDVV